MSSADDPVVQIARWMARVMGIGLAALLAYLGFVAVLRAHGWPQLEQLLTTQGLMTVDLSWEAPL